jgi:hypothetical protein
MGTGTGRSGWRGLLGAVALGLLLLAGPAAPPARATTFRSRPVDCPVCARPFTAQEVSSTNTFGGHDSDLCVHAHGTPPSSFAIWTCPGCRYSARPARFGKGVPADLAKRILSGWPGAPGGISPEAEQGAIPAWLKYDLAGRILEETGASRADLLRHWREAAHGTRCDPGTALAAVAEDKVLGPLLDGAFDRIRDLAREAAAPENGVRTRSGATLRACRELLAEAAPSPAAARARALAAGAELRRRGHGRPAEKALRPLAADAAAPEPVRAAARGILELLDRERGFLGRAVATMRLAPDALALVALEEEAGYRTGWFVAEAFRRLGEDDLAAGWLEASFRGPRSPDALRILAAEVLAGGDAGPLWTAAAEKECAAWFASLPARLADPDRSEEASALLARLASRPLLPPLLKILRGEDGSAAARAATALGGYPEPGPEAEGALVALLADPDGDPETRWACSESLVLLAPEAARPAFAAALAGSDLLREPAIRGLGLVGEADAVPLLLGAAREEPKAALAALSLLAVRELGTVAEAEAWWDRNRKRTRAEWTREALAAAGTSLPAAPGREAIPLLAARLEDEALTIRWAAFRLLRSLAGRSDGRADVLFEGRVLSPTKAEALLTAEEILGGGRIVTVGPVPEFDMGAMVEKFAPDLKAESARSGWSRARARWERWWRERGGK